MPPVVLLAAPHPPRGGAERNLLRWSAHLPELGLRPSSVPLPTSFRGHLQPEKIALSAALPRTLAAWTARRNAKSASAVVSTTMAGDAYAAVAIAHDMPWVCSAQTDVDWHASHLGPLRGQALRAAWLRLVRRADLIVAPSDGMAAQCADLGLDLARIAVIPNCIDPRPELLGQTRVADVCVVGRMVPQKNLHLALEVVRRVDDVTLTLVGDGPLLGQVQADVERLGLRNRVRFAGWVGDAQAVMARHRVLLNTSRTETFGNVLVEALAAGSAVVSTPTDGAAFVRSRVDERMWVASSFDVDEIATLLREALADGSRSVPPGTGEFMASTVAAQWLQILERVGVRA